MLCLQLLIAYATCFKCWDSDNSLEPYVFYTPSRNVKPLVVVEFFLLVQGVVPLVPCTP
jgi:hypothetical protein